MSEHDLYEEKPPRFASWLTEPLSANRGTYIKVGVAAAMINLFGLVTSLFTMTVYDRVVPNNATESLIALSIGLVIVIVFDFVIKILRAYFVDLAGADIDRDIGARVFDRMMRIRLGLKRGSTGALTGMMRELETLRDFFASASVTALVDVPFIILTLAVIALIGGPIVFVPLAMIPLVIGAGLMTKPSLGPAVDARDERGAAQAGRAGGGDRIDRDGEIEQRHAAAAQTLDKGDRRSCRQLAAPAAGVQHRGDDRYHGQHPVPMPGW